MAEIKLSIITFQKNVEGKILQERGEYLVQEEKVLFDGSFADLLKQAGLTLEKKAETQSYQILPPPEETSATSEVVLREKPIIPRELKRPGRRQKKPGSRWG